jgi:succinoglycan biosynthesis transport protein ExoP
MRTHRDDPLSLPLSDSPRRAAYTEIVARLLIATEERPHHSWAVTSASKGDGSTSTAIGIARALAARMEDGLLIDANLRTPSLSEQLELSECEGLSEVLRDGRAMGDVRRRLPQSDGDLWVIPAGRGDDDPVRLLSTPRAAEALGEPLKQHRFVVIDSPALDQGLDALCLASHVDGYILVVQAGKTGTRALLQTTEQIRQAGSRVVGLVLNQHREWIPRWLRRRL